MIPDDVPGLQRIMTIRSSLWGLVETAKEIQNIVLDAFILREHGAIARINQWNSVTIVTMSVQ